MFDTPLMLNPGSRGGAAAAAFAGRVVGGLPGLLWAYQETKDLPQEEKKPSAGAVALRFIGQVGGAAGAAALAAPAPLRTRAAIGAGIGGAIPILGAPMAALGAYIATDPKRKSNPSALGNAALLALGLLAAGGVTYAGVRYYKKRQEDKALEGGNGGELDPGNVDDWGVNLDENEHWGAGPVVGQDGNDYAYVIYHDLTDDTYWYMYKGASTGSAGPFPSGEEAAWCVENRLPFPCVGFQQS